MECVGAEVSQKIRSAIKAKLTEIGVYVDEELPDYVMVMVANKRSKEQMDDDLQLFLGKHTSLFTTWLHQVLQKLHEVSVANLGAKKRKSSEDTKRKKKPKSDGDNKELKKKIKVEPEEKNDVEQSSKVKNIEKTDSHNVINHDCVISSENRNKTAAEPVRREKNNLKPSEGLAKEKKTSTKSSKLQEESSNATEDLDAQNESDVSKSQSVKSDEDDLDDEDFINIRTDGELLDAAEDIIVEESEKNSEHKENSSSITKSNKTTDKKVNENHKSSKEPSKEPSKEKSKQTNNIKDKSDLPSSIPNSGGKILDARDLLNRRKAAKQVHDAERRTRKRSRDKSLSPTRTRKLSRDKSLSPTRTRKLSRGKSLSPNRTGKRSRDKSLSPSRTRKRSRDTSLSPSRTYKRTRDKSLSPAHKSRSDTRNNKSKDFCGDKDKSKSKDQNVDKESVSFKGSKTSDRDRKNEHSRESYAAMRKEERLQKTNSDRNSRHEPMGRRTARNNNDDWNSPRKSNIERMSENRRLDRNNGSSGKRRDLEEPRKRGVLSQVVPRPPEPEEDVETPVPSVVKVTPRPRRPPSQQPSSTLIMKAISEANRSLVNMSPRPDSTQEKRGRRIPVNSRKLREEMEMIPPEKIEISIPNTLALQSVGDHSQSQEDSPEEPEYKQCQKCTNNKPVEKERPGNFVSEVKPPGTDNSAENYQDPIEEWDNRDEQTLKDAQVPEEIHVSPLELIPSSNMEPGSDQTDDTSDPQFVVTLNGYDPDGLYSHSEMDLDEDVYLEAWGKDKGNKNPMLTSTPDNAVSPRTITDRLGSPIVHLNKPSVNHSNLIEVEIMKAKSTDRCKFWPSCRLADKCTFYHPSKPCKMFPACKFGDGCLFIHPQCKFNTLCTRKDCVFSHTPAYTPAQPQVTPKTKVLYATSAQLPCKYYPNCTNNNCQFAHPPRPCRYGLYCTKKECSFDHGNVAPVEKLKWKRSNT